MGLELGQGGSDSGVQMMRLIPFLRRHWPQSLAPTDSSPTWLGLGLHQITLYCVSRAPSLEYEIMRFQTARDPDRGVPVPVPSVTNQITAKVTEDRVLTARADATDVHG